MNVMLTEVLLGAVALEPLRDDKAKSTRKKRGFVGPAKAVGKKKKKRSSSA